MNEPPEDQVELDALLERHLPALRAFVRLRAGRRVAEHESASDLVQSVCRELLTSAERFRYEGEAAFKSWLFTAALRKIIARDRHWRAEKRAGAQADDSAVLDYYATFATPSHDAGVREELARVESAFERLTEEQREVVTLSRLVGLSHAEIAAQIGKSEVNTRQILRRALVRLAEVLEP